MLDRLREIGWLDWNPIGLDGPPSTPADEYDVYLLQAAEMCRTGRSLTDVASYLVDCAEIEMKMAPADRAAASRAASAIEAIVRGR